jgi:hypothetical protein
MFMGAMQVNQRGSAVRHRHDIVRLGAALQAGGDHLGLDIDNAADRFVPVVGTDDEQNIAIPRDGIHDQPRVMVGGFQHGQMFGRSQRYVVLDVVGLAKPQGGESGAAVVQNFGDKTLGHRAVPRGVEGDAQRLIHWNAAWPDRDRAVVDVSEPIRIVRHGRPGGNVVEHDGTPMWCQPFGKRRHRERTTRDGSLVRQEIGATDVMRDQLPVFQKRDRVAL